ncbi:hypothetical protein JP75_06520 [Devosia riboflavina]|uniref:Uncharacterized protein n=1 Tax=Devosia riboflavina TaxID=46914 RepID=A0A087M4C0_9HYPH|nr:hypothetical protein [Devosia riboflavina]KFL31723.1 hypothetical protein JP75_06520 [Devosia riboflavina]
MRTITRFRRDPTMAIVIAAVVSSFISGAGVGVLASMPATAQPAQVIPCASAADPIACLIAEADEEESEPPK